ncbi:hypothetical protein B0I33_101147 [Prauserella shujinwangii]|uniref:Uncharacterized protein n=1 Tax=Prauserella shujinwangii TaxID=1453103 RepID=A0A2T0M2L7_9PSEU|nr:DUF5947 family protein [Prauserella shujinwangii]PRX50995.1 hypothetical protein B0I33_101147 [Prauserella shujinwangii]
MRSAALERVVRSANTGRAEAGERCDLCAEPVPGDHRHLLDTAVREPRCCCRACSILFSREAASDGHYRLLPTRRTRLPDVPAGALGVPVGLAYVVVGDDGGVLAHYPSPVGATRWDVDPAAWRSVLDRVPALRELAPETEALLVNTARGAREHWLVPLDDCFRLVAVVRREWRGLSGGGTVWREIERFFTELTERR